MENVFVLFPRPWKLHPKDSGRRICTPFSSWCCSFPPVGSVSLKLLRQRKKRLSHHRGERARALAYPSNLGLNVSQLSPQELVLSFFPVGQAEADGTFPNSSWIEHASRRPTVKRGAERCFPGPAAPQEPFPFS